MRFCVEDSDFKNVWQQDGAFVRLPVNIQYSSIQ